MKIKMKRDKKVIGSIAILVLTIVFLLFGYLFSKPKTFNEKEINGIFVEKNSTEGSKEVNGTGEVKEKALTVYINGAIKEPGVYVLKSGSRMTELIEKAGGFVEGANRDKLNLAKKLKDEEYVFVEKRNENNGVVPAPNTNITGKTSESKGNSDEKMNLNTVTKEELKKVPGIGEVTAQKIIEYRDKNGGFTSFQDLKKVGRIGDKTIEKFKEKLEIQ